MANIQAAYDWAIETCSNPNVGYSQSYRNQRTINGITYYDCSSFIWYALIAGGWDMVGTFGTWPFTTSTMDKALLKLGFAKFPASEPWKKGDILLRSGHTEMAFDETRTMGAHTANAPLAEQVSVNANDSRNNGWVSLYRWGEGAASEWIKGNRYLSQSEMQNNATIVRSYLSAQGWTLEAICGLLGNMQKESTVNPGIWQNLTEGSGGYGLVQWTPYTNWSNWATQHGYAMDDGNGQLDWINTETVPFGQWIETSEYPISFDEFKASTQTPEYLADCFLKNFERPAEINQPDRQEFARYWFEWFNGQPVPPDNPPMDGSEWTGKMPFWFYLKRRDAQNGYL